MAIFEIELLRLKISALEWGISVLVGWCLLNTVAIFVLLLWVIGR
jgi:hypothetical protein